MVREKFIYDDKEKPMNRRYQLKSKECPVWFSFLLILAVVIFISCAEDYSSNNDTVDTETGSHEFSLSWPEGTPIAQGRPEAARQVDCNATGIVNIVARYYDINNSLLNDPPDEFACSLHYGKVTGLLPGNNYRLFVTGEDASGAMLYSGEATDITIIAGETSHSDEIIMNSISERFVYDDFSGVELDPGKWNQGEFVREVSQGKLVMIVHNSTAEESVREDTGFVNPSSINTIECDVLLRAATLDTGSNSESFVRMDGRFYNAQNAEMETGDIWAGLYFGERGNSLEVWWKVLEAVDENGTNWEEKGSGSLNIPGLSYDQSYTAKIDYDGNNEFVFTFAGVSRSFTGPARQGPEYKQYKALEAIVYSEGGAGNGHVSATFDNVLTDGTAYDDFFFSPLDHTKWEKLEFVRQIQNNMLRLVSQSDGDRENTRLNFSDIHPNIEVRVRVDSSTQIASGDRGIARIEGYFYNDTYGPGSYNGYEGNVWVGVYLNYYGDGTLTAACSGDKTLDAYDTQWENLFYREFNLPIVLDRDYEMAIHFSGSRLRFIIKDTVTGRMDVYDYDITTAVYEPYDEYRSLLSRVYGNSTGGYMAVKFDDVSVDVAEPAATFDATGDWEITGSNPWSFSGCDLPNENDTSPISITQTGNEFTMVVHEDEGDMTIDGKVYGDSYSFLRSDEKNGETEIVYGIFALAQSTSGAGNITFVWFDDFDYCESGFDISIDR